MQCPNCGTVSDFKFCPNCGTNILEHATPVDPIEVKPEHNQDVRVDEREAPPIFSGNKKVAALQKQLWELEQNLTDTKAQARAYFDYANEQSGKLDAFLRPKLENVYLENTTLLKNSYFPCAVSWQNPFWSEWNPSIKDENGEIVELKVCEDDVIRIGEVTHKANLIQKTIRFPIYTSFVGGGKSIIITSKDDQKKGLDLLQALVVRVATLLPRKAKFVLVDPNGMGSAFPMGNELADVVSASYDARNNLEAAVNEMKRMQKYITSEISSFELVDVDDRADEKYQIVFAANFPKDYTRSDFDYLTQIANNGPKRGTYLFLHYNSDYEMPRDFSMDKFENCNFIDAGLSELYIDNFRYSFRSDFLGEGNPQVGILQKIKDQKPPVKQVTWKNSILLPEEKWWKENATERFETPIGAKDGRGMLNFWLGEGVDSCIHGMLIGQPGSGKSILFHVLITGLAMRYSPEELNMYLIDGKDGVSFQLYGDYQLPHAPVISLNTSPELSRSILQDLIDERIRRNNLFSSLSIQNYSEYRKRGCPNGPLPRIILMIDEYQQIFEDDNAGVASENLSELAKQGRSAGIHLFISSQTSRVPNMNKSSDTLSQIQLRMSLQIAKEEIDGMVEFDREAKEQIRSIVTRGRVFSNTKSGMSSENANSIGQVASIEPGKVDENKASEVAEFLEKIRDKTDTTSGIVVPRQIILNGKNQPDILGNPLFSNLMERPYWPSGNELENFARNPIGQNGDSGLEINNWYASEWPAVCWLGHQFTIRGQAAMIFRRGISENAMLIGSNHSVRYGMLATIITSLCVNYSPEKVRFVIFDRSTIGSEYSDVLKTVYENVLQPAGYACTFSKDIKKVAEIVEELFSEMENRRAFTEEELLNAPSIYALMTELETVQELQVQSDIYSGSGGSELAAKFKKLIEGGSKLGIHLILSFGSVRPATKVVDERRGLLHFRHRIAMQMSEDELFTFFKRMRSMKIQDGDEKKQYTGPICALYVDMDNVTQSRFMAYTSDVSPNSPFGSFANQLSIIGKKLASRR